MTEILVNSKTRAQLEMILKNPPQSLLLSGEIGVGLKTVALEIAKKIAGQNCGLVQPYQHKTPSGAKSKTVAINIDDIRELKKLARDRRRENFAIVIDEAEKFTRAAPEAFLKILEEPAAGLHFILTSHRPDSLPATIISRVQTLTILPVDSAPILNDFTEKKLTAQKLSQLKFLAGNLPAEMSRLLGDEEYFRARATTLESAKKFLAGRRFDRLILIGQIKERSDALTLTRAIADLTQRTAAKTAPERLAQNLTLLSQTLDNLANNCNVRAQLTNLALNFA
ncbi:MAG: AAA family ATPase [Candidatus Nomurabacteria bacterium]|jgi:DNA polymerase-3 subunit delta'|nr:AAA family ATPase [Candidatus Nomurabacteria bacterium]